MNRSEDQKHLMSREDFLNYGSEENSGVMKITVTNGEYSLLLANITFHMESKSLVRMGPLIKRAQESNTRLNG
ncbi:MAG: hypothetical protein WAO19_00650 [Candidatus Kryptoniota bacterium]